MESAPIKELLIRVGKSILYVYQWIYEATDGRLTWLGGVPCLLLRTTGRKSGEERTAALVYLEDGDEYVVVASNGGSDHTPFDATTTYSSPSSR